MSTKIKSEKKALKGRQMVMLLHLLCNHALIDIEEELGKILLLIHDRIGESQNFVETKSEALNWYKVNEDIPYKNVGYEGQEFVTFYEITEEELKKIDEETYFVKAGRSLLGDIEAIIDNLSKYADKANKGRFAAIKLSIAAKASEKAKKVIPKTNAVHDEAKKPVTNTARTEDEKPIPAPTKKTKIKRSATQKAIELSEKEGLPVLFGQTIKSKKIGKGIYCSCTIRIRGRKVSKRAFFVDCTLI